MSLLPYQFTWRSLGMLNYRKAKSNSRLLLPYQFPWRSLGMLNFELAGVSIAMSLLPYQFPWRSLGILNFEVAGFNCHVPSSLSISMTFTRNAQFWISRCVNCHVLSSLSIPMTFTRNPQFWSSRFQLPCPFFPINFHDVHSECSILNSQVSIAMSLLPYQFPWRSLVFLNFEVAGFNCHVPQALQVQRLPGLWLVRKLLQKTRLAAPWTQLQDCARTRTPISTWALGVLWRLRQKAGPTARSLQVLGVPRLRFVHLVFWATKSHPPRAFHLAALGTTTLLWICSSGWARARIRAWGRGCHEMSSDVNDQIVSNCIKSNCQFTVRLFWERSDSPFMTGTR